LKNDEIVIQTAASYPTRGIFVSLIGKNIDAFCSRCGLLLAHIVLYEVAGRIQGVQCKTCGAQHRYRGPAPERKPSIPAERRGGVGRAAPRPKPVHPADERRWQQRNAATPPDAVAWAYGIEERYEKNDVIAHPTFGRGFVESVTADGMEVLFREGRKRLAMNRPEAGS
jgi:hypothetical protein